MMAADSLHVAVLLTVPSGMSFSLLLPCRRACSVGASAPRLAQHPAQPSNVQASCLERARPAAIGAFAGGLAADAAAPDRRCPERERRAKAEGKTKGAAPARPQHQSARGGGATRRGFAAVPCATRNTRRCRHTRVVHAPGHALAR